MPTRWSREICTKKYRQQQNFDSDSKEAWHYNHVTFTPIAKNFMLYCRLIYMLSMLYVRLTIKVKTGIPESFKVGWYPHKMTGSSHLNWWVDQLFVDLRNRTVLNPYGLILGSLPIDKVYIIYRKIPKIIIIFGGAYIRRGLSTEGNLRVNIEWGNLLFGSKFTVFALFYFVFQANFPSTSPRGAYTWRGLFSEF